MRDMEPENKPEPQGNSKDLDLRLVGLISGDLDMALARMHKVSVDNKDATAQLANFIRPLIQAALEKCNKELEEWSKKPKPFTYKVSANGCRFYSSSNAHQANLEFVEELKRGLEKKGKMPIDIEVKPW